MGPAAVHYADAQQWGVLSQRWAEYPKGSREAYWVYRSCAQPSPDVFSVLGFSLAGAVSRDKQADGKSLNAEVASALSQSGATISRTQTVNLLRESMYRTCERFMNGAMTQEQFLVQAARDQRAMVAVLAIEQLTGVVLPQPTVIVANGAAIQTDRPLDVLKKLEEAEEAESTAENALASSKSKATDAKKKYDDLNKDGKCKALIDGTATTPAAGTPTPPTKEQCETALNASTAAAADAAEKEKLHGTAKAHLADVRSIISAGPGGGAARSSASGAPGSGNNQTTDAARERVADTVKTIVQLAFNDSSEMAFVCIGVLGRNDVPRELFDACVTRMSAQATSEAKILTAQ